MVGWLFGYCHSVCWSSIAWFFQRDAMVGYRLVYGLLGVLLVLGLLVGVWLVVGSDATALAALAATGFATAHAALAAA